MAFTGSELIRSSLTMILAGGIGQRLYPLTKERTKPSVPFGGKYRIIDFALSNCLNSGLRKVYILTQYKSDSLNRHIFEAWNIFNPELNEFIYSIPPQQKRNNNWYMGTADAIHQNMNLIEDNNYKWIIVLSGDHIYKMDYLKMLQYHVQKGADMSISSIYVKKEDAGRFGVLEIDKNYRVKSFIEKPDNPPEAPDNPGHSFVNMGIYIFNASTIVDVLKNMEDKKIDHTDFGKNVIPYMLKTGIDIYSYRFVDENGKEKSYWVDVGTMESYYQASMDLISVTPHFNLYDKHWPIRTKQVQLPPVKTLSHEGERIGRAHNSLVTDGSIISGGYVQRSLIGPNVRVNSYSNIQDSIIMDDCVIGRHAKIKRAIIDKNVVVPEGEEIGYDIERDKKRFTVTDTNIVVVPKNYIFE